MYVIVYCSNTLPDQIITDALSFEDASWLCTELTAELLLDVKDLTKESYIIQPVL